MSDKLDQAAVLAVRKILDRCARDPLYFLTFCKTRDEHDRTTPNKPFPELGYITHTIRQWHTGEPLQYVAKSRQMMVSWLLSFYAMWTARFRPYSNVLFQSKKEEDAAKMIYIHSPLQARVSFMEAKLPAWLQVCHMGEGKYEPINLATACSFGKINYPNGSRIEAIPQGAAQIESNVPTLFICDEASLQDEWASAQSAAQPAIDHDARGITVGTMRMPSAYGTTVAPCDDVDPDSIMRGVSEFRTAEGVYGLRLHYSADQAKDPATERGRQWRDRQIVGWPGGFEGWQWQQHMEINPLVRSGTPCIPFFRKIKEKITEKPPTLAQMHRWSFDSGLDWGVRNRTVWLVFAMDPLGRRHLIHEFSRPANEVGGIAGVCKIMRQYPLFERLNGMIQADPTIWNEDQNQTTGVVSKARIFADHGVFLQRARKKGQEADEILLDRLLHYYWDGWDRDTFEPLLLISERAEQTLRRLPELTFEEWSEALASERSLKETIKNLNVDEWDAMKYAESAWHDIPAYTAPAPAGSLAWWKARAKRAEQSSPVGNLWQTAKN